MKRLRIAYNNSLCRLLGIAIHSSATASEMFVQLNIKSFGELMRNNIYSFMNRLQCSSNLILSSICKSTVPLHSNIWTWWHDVLTHERPEQHICCSGYTHIMQHRDLLNFTMCMGQYSTHTTSPKQ